MDVRWVLLSVIALLVVPGFLPANERQKPSIQEPTALSRFASDSKTETWALGSETRVASPGSTALIAAVVVLGTELHRGIRVALETPGHTDALYLDVAQAAQLRKELGDFAKWHDPAEQCDAINLCVQGVERCWRPQGPQALCPGTYSTPQGDRGVLLDTPRHSFRFPSTEAATFVQAIGAAIAELGRSD